MKTPITYYGGKQQLAGKIINLIPPHVVYVEPFIGGGAIFFAKEPSKVEIINDHNGEIINFYEVLQRDFTLLAQEISIGLHSRKMHHRAQVIYDNPDMFDRIKRAWAVWMLSTQSFGSSMNSGWSYDTSGKITKKVGNKKGLFTEDIAIRLQNVQLECYDALKIIKSRDTAETFFYLDPPYVGANQGHYDGYNQKDFTQLLEIIEKIEGKFLLSSYRNDDLKTFADRNHWYQLEFKMLNTMTTLAKKPSNKIEVLTTNYPISGSQ